MTHVSLADHLQIDVDLKRGIKNMNTAQASLSDSERIKQLERQNTDLQIRNTELVEHNRVLQNLLEQIKEKELCLT